MTKARLQISDHAVLRYLERSQGLDVKAVRRELSARINATAGDHEGLCGVLIDGMRYVIDGDVVVTTEYRNRSPRGHVRHVNSRDIEGEP